MIYCHTCDLGFCSRHYGEHDLLPDRVHRIDEDRDDVPCCVCDGILRPRPPGPPPEGLGIPETSP